MNEPLHPLQALINGMNADSARKRAETQLTLGRLIAVLEEMPPGTEVANLKAPHSYRGYYTDLAFEHYDSQLTTAGDLLEMCKGCMGQVFQGYKGGNYPMHRNTPLWVAHYGSCGQKLMAVHEGGEIEFDEDDYT